MPENPRVVLCVDDEPPILRALQRTLQPAGYTLLSAGSAAAALEILEARAVDLVIADLRMPGVTGAALLETVSRRWPGTRRLMLSGLGDAKVAGESRFLAKPWHNDELRALVSSLLEE